MSEVDGVEIPDEERQPCEVWTRVNPSYEYMRRIRREEQAKLLGLRRERVVKALGGLKLHGDANAMLVQIAYSVHPHVGAWDAESCDHLRNVLAELIGEARESASGVESHSPCGAGGCHSWDESEEVVDGMAGGSRGMREDSGDGACGRMDCGDDYQEVVGYPFAQYDLLGNERHKAVCALREWKPETNYSTDGMGEIHIRILYQILGLGGAMMMDGADAAKAVRDRLVHLLGGDQSDDSSPMRQENETENLRMELAELEKECDEYRKEMVVAYRMAATFYEECRMYRDMLNDAVGEYKVLQDKLNHVVEVCQSHTEAKGA